MPRRSTPGLTGMIGWCSRSIGLYADGWAMNAYDGEERRGGVAEHAGRPPVPLAQARTRAETPVVDSDEVLRNALDRARRLAEDQPEPFRSLAFSALLQHLLGAAPAGEQ